MPRDFFRQHLGVNGDDGWLITTQDRGRHRDGAVEAVSFADVIPVQAAITRHPLRTFGRG